MRPKEYIPLTARTIVKEPKYVCINAKSDSSELKETVIAYYPLPISIKFSSYEQDDPEIDSERNDYYVRIDDNHTLIITYEERNRLIHFFNGLTAMTMIEMSLE